VVNLKRMKTACNGGDTAPAVKSTCFESWQQTCRWQKMQDKGKHHYIH
jgi:hypothetical protein